jgi:flagellar hook-associated protein 3 FlgL
MRISTNEFLLGSLNNLLSQESTVNTLNQEIASGESMLSPLDDPSGVASALNISSTIQQLSFDSANAQSATVSIQNSLNSLQGVGTVLAQMQNTALQAANGSMNSADRQALDGTVQSALQQLVQLANSQSSDGQYLFAGSKSAATPFTIGAGGGVVFNGDGDANAISLAPSLSIPTGISGQTVFMTIPTGNGSFSVAASGSNTGSAFATAAGVTNASQLMAEHLAGAEFVVTFGAVGTGGSQAYTVASGTGAPGSAGFAATSGVVASGSLSSGSGLDFGGMSIAVSGQPTSGDAFVVAPSQNTSIFQILQNLASALSAGGPDAQQQLENVVAELGSAQNSVLSAQATLGGNLSDIQSVQSMNGTDSTSNQEQLSDLQSANLPQAMTNYNEGVVALQAAEEAFARVQNLSLFNVIGT